MGFYRIYRYPYKKFERTDKHVMIYRSRLIREADRTRKQGKGDVRVSESLSRTKRGVKELAYCNRFDLFCTFTVSQGAGVDRYDLSGCRKRLSQLFNDYKKRYSRDFRYLVIPEFHKDGAVHFHGLVAGIRPQDLEKPPTVPWRNPFTDQVQHIPNVHGYLDWPYYSKKMGFFSCSEIIDPAAVSSYITKYITKDLLKMPPNQQLYMASKGLKRAELIFDCDDVPMPSGKDDFRNDYCRIQWHSRDYSSDNFGCIDALADALRADDPPEEYEQLRFGGSDG